MKFSHFSSLILAVTMASSNAEEKCGSAYQFGNYYVALAFDDYISWEDAKSYVDGMLPPFCGVQGSLVDIRSADENEVVWGTIGGCVAGEEYEWAWIGMTDSKSYTYENDWVWTLPNGDTEDLTYTNWCTNNDGTTEPNNGNAGTDIYGNEQDYGVMVYKPLDRSTLAVDGCWRDLGDCLPCDNYYSNPPVPIKTIVVKYRNVPSDCDDLPGGGAMTDPHFESWAGEMYDFMGQCDLHLLEAPAVNLTIDIRTKIRYDYSYIEAAVVKLGEEMLEVGSYDAWFLNGVFESELPQSIAGYPLSYKKLNKKRSEYTVELGKNEKIIVSTMKDMVSIKIEGADTARFGNSSGMMGEFGTGKLLARDGKTVVEDPNELAFEWQVRDTEPMLFQSSADPQYPKKCALPGPASLEQRRRLGEDSVSLEAAKVACAFHKTKAALEACVHDVLATGDLELADAGAL